MRKIVDYKIVNDDGAGEVAEEVSASIISNWQPFGSPYYSNGYHNQAMVKYASEEEVADFGPH